MTPQADNLRGALLMAVAMVAFTLNDACLKALGAEMPLFQTLLLRGCVTTALLALLAWVRGDLHVVIAHRDRRLMVIRTAAEAGAAWFFVTALFHMDLANVSAIMQSLPLAVTLAAAVVFAEPVGWQRISAIVVGFFGVLMIVQPGGDGFTLYSVYALGSVVCVTVRDLAARQMTRSVPSVLVALVAAGGVTAFAGAGSVFEDWAPVGLPQLALLGSATIFVIGGYIASVSAMRVGEIGFVAPFRYASLVAALILGLVVFGDWPDGLTLAGSALVVATGLFTLYRERVRSRPHRVPGAGRPSSS